MNAYKLKIVVRGHQLSVLRFSVSQGSVFLRLFPPLHFESVWVFSALSDHSCQLWRRHAALWILSPVSEASVWRWLWVKWLQLNHTEKEVQWYASHLRHSGWPRVQDPDPTELPKGIYVKCKNSVNFFIAETRWRGWWWPPRPRDE